jgi:hypothetical protein
MTNAILTSRLPVVKTPAGLPFFSEVLQSSYHLSTHTSTMYVLHFFTSPPSTSRIIPYARPSSAFRRWLPCIASTLLLRTTPFPHRFASHRVDRRLPPHSSPPAEKIHARALTGHAAKIPN